MDSLIGVVPDSWTERPLGELCDILTGPSTTRINSARSEPHDVPVVTPSDLRHNRIAEDCAKGVPPEIAHGLSRYQLHPDDIVCVRTGRIGRQALVGEGQDGWLLGWGCLRLRVRQVIGARYLVYYLGHPAVRDWIERNAGGAVIPTLTAKILGALPVVVPEPAIQAEVADVLGALDDKALVHEQISRTTVALRDAVLARLLPGAPS